MNIATFKQRGGRAIHLTAEGKQASHLVGEKCGNQPWGKPPHSRQMEVSQRQERKLEREGNGNRGFW